MVIRSLKRRSSCDKFLHAMRSWYTCNSPHSHSSPILANTGVITSSSRLGKLFPPTKANEVCMNASSRLPQVKASKMIFCVSSVSEWSIEAFLIPRSSGWCNSYFEDFTNPSSVATSILRCPPGVSLLGIRPVSHHLLTDDSLAPISWAICFGDTEFTTELFTTQFSKGCTLVDVVHFYSGHILTRKAGNQTINIQISKNNR